ncbi:hypothetical protein [Pleurocapsa sp. FMAR1]|uniref:hypothetical protein n=1 Tax=Pleurocapsa sp. FMAR1 TaxID=3040204 RepID=UPI0029C65084|nr:hypothetical protein [Pleurocapsa sp. FMAR1]
MINWYKQIYLFVILIGSFFWGHSSLLATSKTRVVSNSSNIYFTKNNQEINIPVAQKAEACASIDSKYREVYSFETEDYYINICQLEGSFYYHRQSKSNQDETILAPAQAVFSGDIFQANYGKMVYFVGKDGDRYYSTVMQNNSEIVFEPEVEPPVSVSIVKPTVSNVGIINNLEQDRKANLELNNQGITEKSLICTRSFDFNRDLDGWQKLIGQRLLHPLRAKPALSVGQSADTANQYTINNGYNFVYNGDVSKQALIETKEGTVVNLNIATMSQTIKRACVQPVVERR